MYFVLSSFTDFQWNAMLSQWRLKCSISTYHIHVYRIPGFWFFSVSKYGKIVRNLGTTGGWSLFGLFPVRNFDERKYINWLCQAKVQSHTEWNQLLWNKSGTFKLKLTYVSDAKKKKRSKFFKLQFRKCFSRSQEIFKQSYIESLLDIRIWRWAQKSQQPTN